MARLASNLSPHLLQHPRLQEIVSPLFFLREAHFYGNEMTPVLWLNRNFRARGITEEFLRQRKTSPQII